MWTVIIEEDPKTGELILPIPNDLLVEMEWVEGDELVWEETEYPGYTLRKRYNNEEQTRRRINPKGIKNRDASMNKDNKNYKEKLQDMTELNGDGNRERGRYGEDNSKLKNVPIHKNDKSKHRLYNSMYDDLCM